jgi:hypothetical protein
MVDGFFSLKGQSSHIPGCCPNSSSIARFIRWHYTRFAQPRRCRSRQSWLVYPERAAKQCLSRVTPVVVPLRATADFCSRNLPRLPQVLKLRRQKLRNTMGTTQAVEPAKSE